VGARCAGREQDAHQALIRIVQGTDEYHAAPGDIVQNPNTGFPVREFSKLTSTLREACGPERRRQVLRARRNKEYGGLHRLISTTTGFVAT
jgi:hypothetical protein